MCSMNRSAEKMPSHSTRSIPAKCRQNANTLVDFKLRKIFYVFISEYFVKYNNIERYR